MNRFFRVTSIFLIAISLLASAGFAAVPQKISYQGRLLSSSGTPVTNGSYSVTFRIYSLLSGGSALWEETQSVATVDGFFKVNLGDVTTLSLSVFDGSDRWLGITVNPGSEMTPRHQFMSTPYALHSGDWNGLNGDIFRIEGRVGVGAAASTSKMLIANDVNEPALHITSVNADSTKPALLVSAPAAAGRFTASASTNFPNQGVLQARFIGTGAYDHVAVYGYSLPQLQYGIGGKFEGGLAGVSAKGDAYGIYAQGRQYGIFGFSQGPGIGISSYGVYGSASGSPVNWAGYFQGNVNVTGTLSKGGGAFRIDHPLDPENKYLQHSFVESPDMKNIYDGVVVLDASGRATITMPNWFDALNQDFRYQLTAIGAPGPNLYIAQELTGNQFAIAGGAAGMKVSWQVTGIRHDAFAQKNRIAIEVEKNSEERGYYLYPEAFGRSAELGIGYQQEKVLRQRGGENREK